MRYTVPKLVTDITNGKEHMATHKKSPVFVRVTATNAQVVCINPLHVSSFHIKEKSKFKVKVDPNDPKSAIEERVADTIFLYFPQGTGLTYRVGIDITQADFDYLCATLIEFMYLNEAEFKSKSEAIEKARMDDWNKLSKENEAKLPTEA